MSARQTQMGILALGLGRLQSFPSDRTAVAFAAAVFLALYINAKLKVFADYGSFFWKQILVLTPIVGASMIGGGLIVDKSLQHNHIGDVLFGAWLGTVIAMLTYRSSYAAVLDYRYNHVPFAFERAQHRFQYTKESAEQVAKESIATQWWGKYDEEKAISSPSPQRPPTRFNLGIFDGANDHSNPNNTREPQLSPTALESLQQSLQEEEEARLGDVVPYEETLRAEIWKGKQRCSTTTSPQEEQPQIIQGLSPSLSYYLTKQLQSPPQPQLYQSSPPQLYQSSPPQLYHPKSAEPFIAENTAPSNAGGSSPIEGVPVFALNGILTKVNRLLKSKEPSWKIEEKKILNAGIQTQTNGNMPEKVRTCNGNGNGNNRRNGHQSIGIPDEGSSSQQQQQQQQQYHKSVNGKLASSIQIDSSKINTMRNNVDFPTEEEEGIFHMEIEEDPEILEVPGRGSRGVGVGLGKGRVDENERYEGDFGESGKAGGDFVKEVVGCENFGRGKEG
ncbi:MAG: hypothetical protein M1812_007176 [Candelaria pacifica]|nr:MAG: hypothetical protein M1812_007176 [Candelaria pacifica]